MEYIIRHRLLRRYNYFYKVVCIEIIYSVPSILRNSRYRRDQRQLDEEEELWFNEEEEFDEGEATMSQ